MKKQIFCVAGVLAMAVSGSASASLVEVAIIFGPNQHPDGLHDTWQVVARFSDPADQISSVSGLTQDDLNTLDFWTFDGSDMYNQELFAGLPLNDFPSVGLDPAAEAYDSYLTIGATTYPSNTLFGPDFLGDWGVQPPPVQVILGSAFHDDDGAWLLLGVPPMVSNLEDAQAGNDTFDVVIAQITVDNGVGFHLNANIQWLEPLSGSIFTPFEVNIPAPCTIAIIGFACLAGVRRRRVGERYFQLVSRVKD